MSIKNQAVLQMEFQHSIIFWGCENGSDGEDKYINCHLPFSIGDNLTRGDKNYKITSKDWDFDNNTIYFVATKNY